MKDITKQEFDYTSQMIKLALGTNDDSIINCNNGWKLFYPPVFGLFNDGLEIYIKRINNNVICILDDSTLYKLLSPDISKSIIMQIDDILLKYGLQRDNDEICLEVSDNNLESGYNTFLSALKELHQLKSDI